MFTGDIPMSTTVAPALSFVECRRGFWRLLPLSLFVAAFGAAFGLAAVQTGLQPVEIVLMSATVFAGTAQFAALDLWGAQVPLVPLLVTTLAINARMLLMGATLYPWLALVPPRRRYASLITLSDANWAMALNDLQSGRNTLGALVGGGLAIWLTWLAGTLAGMVFGGLIADPRAFGVDMVLGCFMLSMALAGRRTLRTVAAWIAGGLAAWAALHWLPANTHVVAGGLAGGLVGALWLERGQ
tara:strand:+ start:66188 stop:66913 length:726 start_codon:yes stop_codon:yes gene_type:complete